MYQAPYVGVLKTVLGRMVSQNTISAEGRILTNVYWDYPEMNTLGFFLLESRGSIFVVKRFLKVS